MNGNEKLFKALEKNPTPHKTFFNRPHWTRRQMFNLAGVGMGGFLAGTPAIAETVSGASVTPIGKAKNVIFVLLAGAPSHTDLFDFKMVDGATPAAAKPETFGALTMPTGILPQLSTLTNDFAVVRSVRAWGLVHSLMQTWTQIGRNPAAVLGDITPNVGSIVALEKTPERTARNVFPTFLALNSNGAVGAGYFDNRYAPFKTAPAATGLANTTHSGGESVFNQRWNLLHDVDGTLRQPSPLGKRIEDMDDFYNAARGLMYNPDVDRAFRYSPQDSLRYAPEGSTAGNAFGNACLVAKQVLAQDAGTRFIQITLGGWDMHQSIYGTGTPNAQGVFANNTVFGLGRTLDAGLANLIRDLQAAGLYEETLIVAVGEFGRTVGRLNAATGRDHFPQQFAVFAGAGVKGGRVIGSTDATGSRTLEPGWAGTAVSGPRDVRPEDIEATILSAAGIDWTTVRTDDPFGRGFEYVYGAKEGLYGPVHELWKA